jgi:hypothetical protein
VVKHEQTNKWNGVFVSSGNTEFMDGAQVVSIMMSDLVHFSGPFQGYSIQTKKGESTFSKVEGKLTTTLSSDGTPVTTLEGTFHWIKGTGQYENIQGGGTFKVRAGISQAILVQNLDLSLPIQFYPKGFLSAYFLKLLLLRAEG